MTATSPLLEEKPILVERTENTIVVRENGESITRTCKVVVRHSEDCRFKNEGPEFESCKCRKSLRIYDSTLGRNYHSSAKTRNWETAVKLAQNWLNSFDPDKKALTEEVARFRAKKEKIATIPQAVAAYFKDMEFRQVSDKTIKRTRTLLGTVDASGNVTHNGKFFDWLDTQTPKPVLISEITPAHLTQWRTTWGYGSDLTAAVSWDSVKAFFKFCKGQGWISISPANDIQRPRVEKGNRTAIFTDKQYDLILSKAKGNERLEAFLELARWSGMALIDVVVFNTKTLDAAGVLRYNRSKTGKLATVKLPAHVVTLLRNVPLESDNSPEQPFRRDGIAIDTDTHAWRRALQDLFKQAGITKVKTDVGERTAHPHMLRDTCAVWYLRHKMSLHGVATILGDNVKTVERHYLPFVQELENAHIEENSKILDAVKPKPTGEVVAFVR
jgi:integrase